MRGGVDHHCHRVSRVAEPPLCVRCYHWIFYRHIGILFPGGILGAAGNLSAHHGTLFGTFSFMNTILSLIAYLFSEQDDQLRG